MKASELLSELFQGAKTPWKWSFRGSEEAFAEFQVGEVKYRFHTYVIDRHPFVWEVDFSVDDDEVRAAGKNFALTGTGNSASVMSAVVAIMKEFIKEYGDKIDVLEFSAKEGSRQDLYSRMVQRLLPDWELAKDGPNYSLTKPQNIDEAKAPVEKDMTQCSDRDLQKLLGKGKLGAMVRHPWFQEYRNYEHAYKHGVSKAGFTKVEVYSFFRELQTTPDGKIRPLIMTQFTFSYGGTKVIQVEKYYRDKVPDENEKRLGPAAGWKHLKSWAQEEDLVNKAWDKHWDNKQEVSEAETYTPPTLHTGDVVMKGKFKNSPAEIKGFKKDKHNQPVLKTNKGDIQLFKPRVSKLMKEEIIDEYEGMNAHTPNSKEIFLKLQQLGYENIGGGQDATVWSKDEGSVIKILMPSTFGNYRELGEKGFLFFYDICQKNKQNPHLPRFIDVGGVHHTVFEINGVPYRQIAMERLLSMKEGSFEQWLVWQLSDLAMVAFIKWRDVLKQMLSPDAWKGASRSEITENMPTLIREKMRSDPNFEERTHQLFATMQDLYTEGRANGLRWDLHTDNVMQRKDGTLVIIDPYFA